MFDDGRAVGRAPQRPLALLGRGEVRQGGAGGVEIARRVEVAADRRLDPWSGIGPGFERMTGRRRRGLGRT